MDVPDKLREHSNGVNSTAVHSFGVKQMCRRVVFGTGCPKNAAAESRVLLCRATGS